MKQQIIISGIGGQGVVFVTRVVAEAALAAGFNVLTSETHGMAMRGGTVVSHVKVGDFRSPLVPGGQADIGLFLHKSNLDIHSGLMKKTGRTFVNAPSGNHDSCSATELAKEAGTVVVANLVLLGFAAGRGALFCTAEVLESVIKRISKPRQLETNLQGLRLGLSAAGKQLNEKR